MLHQDKAMKAELVGGSSAEVTGVASHTKPGHLIELKYVPILKIYKALDKNDSFLIV